MPSVRIRMISIRRQLADTPFAIATAWGAGYGLFPADQVICEPSLLTGQHLYRLAPAAVTPLTAMGLRA